MNALVGILEAGDSRAVWLQLHPRFRVGFWFHNEPGVNVGVFKFTRREKGLNFRVWRFAASYMFKDSNARNQGQTPQGENRE